MKVKQTLLNRLMIKLDPDNDRVKLKSGGEIYIDNTYEPEKHIVVLGEVINIPDQLLFSKKGNLMPWKTQIEIKIGDRVLMYYLAVQNCISKEQKKYIKDKSSTYIFIAYNNIYAVIRDDKVIPVNGYILVEPINDPFLEKKKQHYASINLQIVDIKEKSKRDVVFGKIIYLGGPVKSYLHDDMSDDLIDVKIGDEIVMKKIRDIPAEYEYHSKIDGGRKLYRIQRHDILATL